MEQRDTLLVNLEEKLLRMEAAKQHPQSQTRDTGSWTGPSSQAEPQPSLPSPLQTGPSRQNHSEHTSVHHVDQVCTLFDMKPVRLKSVVGRLG